ncbi:hypothetical protein pdam_00014535 [Pocillopora damicornis]|uniref:Uncharacterized protein n=1 Tax=Pocillopora damicornis TaxID=46731 RepID=A0A3M6V430_POCDA|nr:hypothetical protein pdam_00014535 [Pocillopora damicornis]
MQDVIFQHFLAKLTPSKKAQDEKLNRQPELHSVDSDTCFEVKWSGGEGTVNMNKIDLWPAHSMVGPQIPAQKTWSLTDSGDQEFWQLEELSSNPSSSCKYERSLVRLRNLT